MSNQTGPGWYPSKQFTHTPPVPGAPSAPATAPPPPRAARPGGLRGLLRRLTRRA